MNGAGACLTPGELARLAEGAAASASEAAHLARCPACRAALDEFVARERFLQGFASDLSEAPSPAPPPHAVAPPSLDGYRVVEELRRGGQGVVFHAVHEASGRSVALKVVRAGSYRRRARLEREARLAARLRHPNIVAIHDCGELADGRYALALELVDGVPLDEWSRRLGEDGRLDGPIRRDRRLRAFAKICDAIEHAHRHAIIHRDLKPDNILIDADDEPRVLDFGIARETGDEDRADRQDRVTVTGEIACTLAYAAPEQLTGDSGLVDARSDVYALGVVLYELLTGRLPHETGTGIADLVTRITEAPPPAPSSLPRPVDDPAIDTDLDTIVMKALSKDPERRYATAAALKADVLHYLAGEPIDARRDSAVYLLMKSLRRHRRGVSLAAVAALAVLAGLVATAVGTIRAREAGLREEAERSRLLAEGKRREAVTEVLREIVPPGNPNPETNASSETHAALNSLSFRLEAGLFSDDPEAAAATRMAIGDLCADRGALRRAEVEYRQALRILLSREEPEDSSTASTMERLALLLVQRSSPEEASQLAEKADRIRTRLLGDDHPDTLRGRCTLASIALACGDRGSAESITAAVAARASGPASSDTQLADRLAELECDLALARGDRPAANKAAEWRLRTCLVGYGDAHPALRRAVLAFAATMPPERAEEAGRLQAIAGALQAGPLINADPTVISALLAEKRSLLGANHPDLLETTVTLGERLYQLDRFDEALPHLEEAERLAMPDGVARTVGEADLKFLRARTLGGMNRIADASILMEEIIAELRPILKGRDDMHLATRIKELAGFYSFNRQPERFRALDEEAIEILRNFSPHHPQIGWFQIESASHEYLAGDPARAVALAEEGIAALAGADRTYNWHKAMGYYYLGLSKQRLGHFDEALANFTKAKELIVVSDAPEADKGQTLARYAAAEAACRDEADKSAAAAAGTERTEAGR